MCIYDICSPRPRADPWGVLLARLPATYFIFDIYIYASQKPEVLFERMMAKNQRNYIEITVFWCLLETSKMYQPLKPESLHPLRHLWVIPPFQALPRRRWIVGEVGIGGKEAAETAGTWGWFQAKSRCLKDAPNHPPPTHKNGIFLVEFGKLFFGVFVHLKGTNPHAMTCM